MTSSGNSGNADGTPPTAPAKKSRPVTRPGDARRERMAQSFTDIVGVLMRDREFKNLRISELEWLVLPAIMSGQWRLLQAGAKKAAAKPAGSSGNDELFLPVAAALWASVSLEIDTRLSENLDKPLQLRPDEWASGENLWLVAIAGDRRYFPKFLKSLDEADFKGKNVKMRAKQPDGTVVVETLNHSA